MGDFPRWVDREDVDSQAMLSAYMWYVGGAQAELSAEPGEWMPSWWGHLTLINHRVDPWPGAIVRPAVQGLAERDCDKRACSRCRSGRGGYQFRWYSPYWAGQYNKLRRPGAWEAPESSACSARGRALRFWQRRELAAMPP